MRGNPLEREVRAWVAVRVCADIAVSGCEQRVILFPDAPYGLSFDRQKADSESLRLSGYETFSFVLPIAISEAQLLRIADEIRAEGGAA